MLINRPYVLSIAGFDPSAGAGVLADVKTLEGLKVYGLAISTSIAIQTDKTFFECRWEDINVVKFQIRILFERYAPQVIKVGLIPSISYLNEIVDFIFSLNSEVKIIWDPVHTSSTGYQFIEDNWSEYEIHHALSRIYLLTPNRNEVKILSNVDDALSGAKKLSEYCSILLKGGHSDGQSSTDILFSNASEIVFKQERFENASKHGSGCVLSSAIAAYVAQGQSLESACENAKKYINSFLKSSNSLIGYHAV